MNPFDILFDDIRLIGKATGCKPVGYNPLEVRILLSS